MKSDDVNRTVKQMTTNRSSLRVRQLAERAGFVLWDGAVDWSCSYDDELEKFAELVRADEREACAEVCEDLIGTRAMARHCADAIIARGEAKLKEKNGG